jgi:hypothetical protein
VHRCLLIESAHAYSDYMKRKRGQELLLNQFVPYGILILMTAANFTEN